jgi:hypothetical protein
MQWNFWLSENWSVFGEPGGLIDFDKDKLKPKPAFYAGGRFHFSDDVTLTMRVGHPTASVGVSFLPSQDRHRDRGLHAPRDAS